MSVASSSCALRKLLGCAQEKRAFVAALRDGGCKGLFWIASSSHDELENQHILLWGSSHVDLFGAVSQNMFLKGPRNKRLPASAPSSLRRQRNGRDQFKYCHRMPQIVVKTLIVSNRAIYVFPYPRRVHIIGPDQLLAGLSLALLMVLAAAHVNKANKDNTYT